MAEIQTMVFNLKQRFWFRPAIYALFFLAPILPKTQLDKMVSFVADKGLIVSV